ncbi:MAG TPA: RagB/SusD family nutrient uptake outer membrane protein, partial [Sphingobacteriaceae bacterium]|nr:RagB/SusD family nutrient uptake outer membrane protein [Sphingobacteriaceae bacterium]
MKFFLIFSTIIVLTSMGCKKELLDVQNQNQYTDASYFKNESQLNEAVVATYAVFLHKGMYSRDYYFIFDLLGNDAERDAPMEADLVQLATFSFGSSNPPLTSLWGSLYRMIFRANLVIEKCNEWNPSTAQEKQKKLQFISEASFLKGWAELNLVMLWGRVPLRPNYLSSTELQKHRSSVDSVWKAVESDLMVAQQNLPVTYASADLGRATKGAAIALLGKAYLYENKYALAIQTLQPLTQAPYSYSLDPSYDHVFSETSNLSPETIFAVDHLWIDWSVGNTWYMFGGQEYWGGKTTNSDRSMEYGWNDWRNVFVSPALVKAFKYKDESNNDYTDPRAALTFYGDSASGGATQYCSHCSIGVQPYPFTANGDRWRKYENYEYVPQMGNLNDNINTQVIRYADVLLMLAEANIQTGSLSAALPLINQVRARVGAFQYTTLGSQNNAMQILMRERQLEMCGEQSRWFD